MLSVERLLYEVFLLQKCNKFVESDGECSSTLMSNQNTNIKDFEKKSIRKKFRRLKKDSGANAAQKSCEIYEYPANKASLSYHLQRKKTCLGHTNEKCCNELVNNKKKATKDMSSCTSQSGSLSLKLPNENKVMNSEKKLWECPICFEASKGQTIVTTICGHVFCRACIEDYLKQSINSQCPSCRSEISCSTFITLYNV